MGHAARRGHRRRRNGRLGAYHQLRCSDAVRSPFPPRVEALTQTPLSTAMARNAPTFVCQNCGAVYGRWQGKCEACGEWNTIAEESGTGTSGPGPGRAARKGRAFALEPLAGAAHEAPRLASGVAELDRVTGGGFVRGS